jgi:hypothetical protein
MIQDYKKGDRVKLMSVPDWLVGDLPANEKQHILECVGKVMTISEVDKYGYYWVGFGEYKTIGDDANYYGHSFCVPPDCLQHA